MKKILIYLFVIFCIQGTAQKAFSQDNAVTTDSLCTQSQSSINNFMKDYFKYTNEHNVPEITRLYADNYVSGDGLKKDAVVKLIKDAWTNYPNIKIDTVIKSIRISDQYATVETYDKSYGSSANKSDITGDIGNLESESYNVIYLQKFGKGWKIISDKTTYEKTIIKFGTAKPLKVSLTAPEQVLSGENYTASLETELPSGMIALGSITREPIVYPETKPTEVYRQITNDGSLERFLKANATNNNEFATASVGYTEVSEDIFANPEVKLTGMAIILTRVNVIPASTFVPQNDKLKVEPDLETIDKLPENTDKKDLNE